MRCALRTIRLSAAWRKICSSRTTGSRPERDQVGQHLARARSRAADRRRRPGSARPRPAAPRAAPASAARRPSTSRRPPAGRRSAGARRRAGSRARARPRAGGAASWHRARCSRRGAARRARSAPRAGPRAPARSRPSRIASTSVVLPVPGPPVMTRSLLVSAIASAVALVRRRARSASACSTASTRASGSAIVQGGRPTARRRRLSAIARSA